MNNWIPVTSHLPNPEEEVHYWAPLPKNLEGWNE